MYNMDGKICMVTGANSGIGYETALALANMGATVILVCRNAQRGEVAQANIASQSGNQDIDLLLADLSSQAEIRQLAETFHDKYDKLHVLVNNAGAIFPKRQKSVDNLEMTFALNHLGYFLLTNLLLDTLKASAPARVVNVSSAVHFIGSLDFDNLQLQTGYSSFKAYANSKLANIFFTFELARRLKGTGVTATCMNPGPVATNFGKRQGGLAALGSKLVRPFIYTPKQGAETVIYLAAAPEVQGVTGEYFDKKKAAEAAPTTESKLIADRLWRRSEILTGLAEPKPLTLAQ